MRRLRVVSGEGDVATYVVKSNGASASNPGIAREALFYRHLADGLPTVGGARVTPRCVHASGDMATGEKVLVLEDLSHGTVVGDLIGVGHPYTWSKRDAVVRSTVGGPGPVAAIRATFESSAAVHARHWRSAEVAALPWLNGSARETDDSWRKPLLWSRELWESQRGGAAAGVTVSPELTAIVDASFAKLSWSDHVAAKARTPQTLVQGDFHPYNALWVGDASRGRVVLIDWEMARVGSAAQDLGQFMLGNVAAPLRRGCERGLLEAYRGALLAGGVPERDCDADALWAEYVHGGAAKWVWLMPILTEMMPQKDHVQWFWDQLAAWCADHGVTPDRVGQPRT